MKKLRNNKIRKLLAFMVALALMVSCMPSAYTISASEAFGDGTEDIFTDGEITSEPAAEESTPDVSSADQEETEQAQQSTLTYENDSVKVTAEALEDGALPQNTALKADSVNENSSVSYDTVSQKLSAAATDKGSSLRGFFAYDVYFADGDGNRVEPNGRVRVTFEYKTPAAPELTDAASTSVTVEKLHYNSSTGDTDVNTLQANEDLKVLNVNEGKQIQTLQVETGNAAVFAVMWDSPETADVEAEAVSGNEDEVPIASEELTDGMDISDEPEQDAAETPAAENPDAEPTEAPAEDPDVVEEPAEDIASPEEVPAADENGETSLIEVLGDDTNLRVSPSIEAEVLATVNAGTQFTLLDTVTAEDGATWYKVSWEGTEAYIRSDMAQVVDSSDEAEEPEDVLESEEVSYSQEVGNVVVTATAAKGVIPEGAQFVVTPIEKGSDQYADIEKQLHEGAENESYTVAGFLAYDISFLNDDGTKIEPQNGSVRVSIAYKEAEIPEDVAETDTAQENMNVSLVHFVEDANGNVTEVVNMSNDGQAEVSTTDNGEIESANFETESFSTFSVVWLADDFTSVQTTSSYGVEETVDSAKRGITINMFNYDTAGINEGHSLKFSNGSDGGNEDYNKYRGPSDLSLGIMQKRLGEDSYPIVDKGKKESSSYLFSTKEGTGKEFYSDANYLFKQDADGYYEYDSTKNFAQFNKNTKEFTVYKVPGSSKDPIDLQQGSKHGSFFPFNTLGDHKYWGIPQISEKSPDFHFGMTMSAKFIQPKDGKINGNNMVFEFSGDDDVWVYIDGVLVLDIGGIHNEVLGSINFADGTVKVGSNINTNLKKLFNDANIKGDFVSGKSIFKDYTAHTINFYYLERGKGDSNCKLKFNLPTVPKQSVTVEKQLSNTDKEKYANVEFKFQLLLQDDKGEYVPSNTAGTLSDDSEVEFNREEINGVPYDNVFTLKPGQKAIFSGLEENKNYKVRELGVSKDRYDRVLINGEETTNENGNVISKEATVGSRPVVVVTNVLASVAELDLKKVNKDQKALSGAQFTLVNSKTKESQSAISADGTGRVNFTRLGLGTYTLTEDLAPDGYEASNESWIVKVTLSDDKKAVATLYKADGKTKIEKDTSDSLYHIMNYTQQEIIESSMDYSKTATVNDWDKRIYDINITASSKTTSSSVVTTGGIADVVMALDVSGSMRYTQTAGDTETDYSKVGRYNEIRNSLNPNKIYYYNKYYKYYKYPMINVGNKWMYYYTGLIGSYWQEIGDSDDTKIYQWPSRITALKEVVNQFIRNTATSSSESNIGLGMQDSADAQQEVIWGLIKFQDPKVVLPTGVTAKQVTAANIDLALSKVAALTGFKALTDKTKIEVSEAGIYAIKAEEEGYTYKTATAYVGFGEPYPALSGTEVIAKKSSTSVDKTTEDADHVVAIGDIVTYKIEAYVPFIDAANAENRTFTITDKITGADYYLTGPNAVNSVTMEGKDGQVGEIVVNDKGNGFIVDLGELVADTANPNAGKKITVTYTVKVNETTVENKAGSHAAGVDYGGNNVPVKLFTGELVLMKYGDGDVNKALEGAEFVLYKDGEEVPLTFVKEEKTGKYKYAPDTEGADSKLVTDANGYIDVEGLDVGSYHFEETKAPKGYSINTDGKTLTLTVDGEVATAKLYNEGGLNDTKLNSLPSTGGMGTYLFTIIGVVVMAGAAGAFFISRRKGSEE